MMIRSKVVVHTCLIASSVLLAAEAISVCDQHDTLVYGRYQRSEFESPIKYSSDGFEELTIPDIGRPAMEADVKAGHAIFTFEGLGKRRFWRLPKYATFAIWHTNKTHPFSRSDGSVGYRNNGYVCQAEELLVNGKWRRYFGFVSRHGAAVLPGEDVHLWYPDRDGGNWMRYPGGLDWGIYRPNAKDAVHKHQNDPFRLDQQLLIKSRIRNRRGVARALPDDLYRKLADGTHSFRRGVTVHLQSGSLCPRPFRR